jgi:hypothetical protein
VKSTTTISLQIREKHSKGWTSDVRITRRYTYRGFLLRLRRSQMNISPLRREEQEPPEGNE